MHIQTLLQSPQDKELLYEIINILFRTNNNERLAKIVDELITQHELGDFFSSTHKALFWIFQHSTKNIPDISIPFFKEYIKQECKKFLMDVYNIDEYLEKFEFQDKEATITFLDPMALYEEEALKTVEKYIQILANDKVKNISIDLYTIEPKINFLTKNLCLTHLENKLSMILRQALKYSTTSACVKRIYFELDSNTFNRTFEALNKIILKEEFRSSLIGFSFKLDKENPIDFLKRVVTFSEIIVALGGQKVTLRLEENTTEFSVNTHFQHCVHWLLNQEHKDLINVVINSYNTYHLELLNVMRLKNGLESMVKVETFMGFLPLCKQCKGVYCAIVSFDEFIFGIDYLLEKLKLSSPKAIFYDFESKNILFLSALCHQKKSLEQILEKINLVYEKSSLLQLELLIEEELSKNEYFMMEMFKSIQSLFRCFNPTANVTLEQNRQIEIALGSFYGTISFRSIKNIIDAVDYIQTQPQRCSCKIYTQYKAEEELFYRLISS